MDSKKSVTTMVDERAANAKMFKAVVVAVLVTLVSVAIVLRIRNAFTAVESAPGAAADELKKRNLARFEAWKVEARKSLDDTIALEKTRLAEFAKVLAIPDFTAPLAPQYKARADLYTAVRSDVKVAFSGQPFDAEAAKKKYFVMLLLMEDARLRDALIGVLEPAQTFSSKLNELNSFTDIKAQVDEYKAILTKEAEDRAKKELFSTDIFTSLK